MASPRCEGSLELPSLRVQRLESSGAADTESVVMVKLTDEIFSALMTAAKKNTGRLQVRVDSKGGAIDLGSLGLFHFQTQKLNGETDTIAEDVSSEKYHMAGSFRTKYQVQATDKSFADTREKAQKLMEEEKSKGAKEATSRLSKNLAPRIGSASSSRHSSPLLGKVDSKISPNKVSSVTGNNSSSTNGWSKQNVDPLAGELKKKKLRSRVVHLIVTGRYSSVDEVSHQLKREGVNEEDGWVRKVEEIVSDISETRSSGKLSLKPSCYPEVDPRWPWFNREEKDAVRRMLSNVSSKPQLNSSAFAPMRKKGIDRMQAPAHTTTVSPEAIPTPPASRPGSGDGGIVKSKSISPPIQQTTIERSPSPANDVSDYVPQTTGNKRTAHVPNQSTLAKRPRQESASPPEDPTISTSITHPPPKKLPAPSRGGNSSASSRLSSPCSLSSPQNPSCDWEKKFPEIKTVADAERYFNMFHKEYPIYMECFKTLHQVAQEFRDLDEKLKKASRSTKESSEIERGIQRRYAHFEKDPLFLRSRQQHADLRSKLTVLKQRISDWERAQDSQTAF